MAAKFGIGTSPGIRAPLLVFVDRHRPAVADAAVRPPTVGRTALRRTSIATPCAARCRCTKPN